jgi:hypothetical protein
MGVIGIETYASTPRGAPDTASITIEGMNFVFRFVGVELRLVAKPSTWLPPDRWKSLLRQAAAIARRILTQGRGA